MRQSVFPRHPRTQTARPTAPWGWSSIPRIAYVCLLAFVFPFICWGRMGQAGHRHPLPHFVFAQPIFPAADGTGLTDRPAISAHDLHKTAEEERPQPAGQAVPDSLVLFLLLLVIAETTCRLYRPVRRSLFAHLALGASQADPRQPTPPPRPAPRSLALSI